MNNLFFHLLFIHDEHKLTSSLLSSSLYHVERNSISNTNHVCSCDKFIIHRFYYLDNILSVTDLTVSDNDDMSLVIGFLFLFFIDNIDQRRWNLCSTVIGLERLKILNSLLDDLVAVFLTLSKQSVEFWSETDDVKIRVLRKWHQEKHQGLDCLLYSFTPHRTRPVEEENVFPFVLVIIGFFRSRSVESHSCAFFTCCTENIVRFLMTVSKLQIDFGDFSIVKLKFHFVHWDYFWFQFMACALICGNWFATVEGNTKIPLCLSV